MSNNTTLKRENELKIGKIFQAEVTVTQLCSTGLNVI